MSNEEKQSLRRGYEEIIELVEDNMMNDFNGFLTAEETLEKVVEIADKKLNGEI